jgi:hypothetical protein
MGRFHIEVSIAFVVGVQDQLRGVMADHHGLLAGYEREGG